MIIAWSAVGVLMHYIQNILKTVVSNAINYYLQTGLYLIKDGRNINGLSAGVIFISTNGGQDWTELCIFANVSLVLSIIFL